LDILSQVKAEPVEILYRTRA